MKRPNPTFYVLSMLMIVTIAGTIFLVIFAGTIR